MTAIDAHQHFWNYDAVKHSWINEDMAVLKKDFLPQDLKPLLDSEKIEGCIAVQADESERENTFLLDLANENSIIKGVVGWLDFMDEKLEARLDFYSHEKLLKGFRFILQDKPDRALMLNSNFKKNIGLLLKYNFTYDLLIFTDQLSYANDLVKLFPNQKFVLDHMAKPLIKKGTLDNWKEEIINLAKNENVYCKVSGMVTEADWQAWEQKDFVPYLDAVTNAFGPKRLMYGSDWPVCLLAAEYNKVISIVKEFYKDFSDSEKQDIFGTNASNFYNLSR